MEVAVRPTNLSLPGGVAYYQRLEEAFTHAAGAGVTDHFYNIGGYLLQARCAGDSLRGFLQAFEHLRTAPAAPDLTVCLVDTAATGCGAPELSAALGEVYPPEDALQAPGSHEEVLGYLDDSVVGALHVSGSTGIYWVQDERELPINEFGAPLFRLLHWWFSRRDRQLLHAAAVGLTNGGVLLAGKSGAGKSTSALACLDSPLGYAGDDHCLVSTEGPPRAFSLYSSTKVHWENPVRATITRASPARRGEEKALYYIHQTHPRKTLVEFPVRAILIPRVTDREDTVVRRISAAEAFLAAALSTVTQLPGEHRQTYSNIGWLFRQVPCYALDAGSDLRQIPRVILNLLQAR